MLVSCRLTQLRCWVVPGRDSSSSASSVRRVPSLHSAVRLRRGQTWPLFLHTSAGVNPAGSVPGVQDTAVPAVGADSVSHHGSVRQHTPPPRIRAARHRLRGFTRISVVASCPYSKASACSRSHLYPASTPVTRSQGGPFRPRSRRPSAQTLRCRSLSAAGSLKSPVRGPAKARQLLRTRPPPGPSLRFAPAPWWFGDSKAGLRINPSNNSYDITRPTARLRDSKPPRPTG